MFVYLAIARWLVCDTMFVYLSWQIGGGGLGGRCWFSVFTNEPHGRKSCVCGCCLCIQGLVLKWKWVEEFSVDTLQLSLSLSLSLSVFLHVERDKSDWKLQEKEGDGMREERVLQNRRTGGTVGKHFDFHGSATITDYSSHRVSNQFGVYSACNTPTLG